MYIGVIWFKRTKLVEELQWAADLSQIVLILDNK